MADIHPFLLLEYQRKTWYAGMVGGAERYMFSDNTKKISLSHDEK
jgi:hypothetical protein